jgi:starch-binding outer membrane protein, SusD/RagB family
MKKLKYILSLTVLLSFLGCEEYLDKAPESDLTVEEVFKNFVNAQGFMEEIYAYVVDYAQGGHWETDYLWGDESICNEVWLGSGAIDRGEFFGIVNPGGFNYVATHNLETNSPNNASPFDRPGIYEGGVKAIRKANLVIENIDKMVDATQAEKDVILGQAYFFRAFFHLEIMKFWGRYPYIDHVITDDYALQRPETYKESALRAYEDFMMAAELLPVNWDDEPYGQYTLGENRGRVTKGAAYAYAGENMLLAASPLMHNSQNTYDYDAELAGMAVDAFAEVLKLDDAGVYDLVPWDRIEEVFWRVPTPMEWPGSTEFIFNNTSGNDWAQRYRFALMCMPNSITGNKGTDAILSPTHNYIYNNFGMANGLSIEDDLSGAYGAPTYDPAHPFDNRDPRFYKWLIVDGDTLADRELTEADANFTAKLYVGGAHDHTGLDHRGSQTGYFYKKYYPTYAGTWYAAPLNAAMPWRIRMRLTDIYLMYAEALQASENSATVAPASYSLTAEEALNILRDRVGIPHINALIVSDPHKFMDEIRRERAVELCYEGQRWFDIRRWSLAHLDKYRIKTGLDFPQDHSSFTEVVLFNRVCEFPKHFWLPFQTSETQLYEGFPQNPGW